MSASPALAFSTPDFAFRSPPLFADDELRLGSVELRLPLFTGGRLTAGIQAARAAERAADALHTSAGADLRLAVAAAYVEVLRAVRSHATAEATVAGLASHHRDVTAMVEQDLVPMSDLLAAKVSLAHAEQQRLTASHTAALALAAYNRQLGEPQDRVVNLEAILPASLVSEAVPLTELIKTAVAARPELFALGSRTEQLSAEATAEARRQWPQLALTGGWQHVGSQLLDRQNYSMVGIGLQWQLFDGGATRQRAAALRFAARANAQRADDARSGVELQVRSAWLETHDAAARLQVAAAAMVEAAENERQSREQYGAGLTSNTQVLDAVRLRTAASGDRDGAEFDLALSRLRLAHAIGAL